MLSVNTISAAQAVSYYSGDNYYSNEKGIEESAWWGKGAEELGLSGQIRPEDFENMLQGKSPDGSQQLVDKRSVGKSNKERAGIDMTFSAPKSVTLTSLVDDRLVEAHRKAVNTALELIEKEVSYVRLGKDKKVEAAGNLTVAQFHHDTSRKTQVDQHPDPQLHTHCVALNMISSVDENGQPKWRSFYNDGVFNNSKLFGMVYQNALAQEVKRLGYQIEQNGNGTFEIAGYTREQLEEFSKRRMQIVALEATSKKQERAKMLGTRLAKGEELPTEVLKKAWLEQIKEAGIRIPEPGRDKGHKVGFDPEIADKAIDSAIRHFAERDVSFRDRKAIAFAMENFIGEIPSYEALKKALTDHDRILCHSQNYFGDKNYTTAQAIFREKETIGFVKEGQGKAPAIATAQEVDQFVQMKPESMRFTKGQEEAFRLVATTTDQIVGWQGVAGAGKSYALKDFKELGESKGYRVVGLAPDASAAKVLGESAEIAESKTVASFLVSPRSKDEVRKPEIWVVDEAGKMSAREMHALLEKAFIERARVVLVGDTRQLSAVEAGNPFKSLQEHGLATAHLTEHRRQKTEQLKAAVNLLSQGKVAEGLKEIRSEVTELSLQKSRVKAVTDAYMQYLEADEKQAVKKQGQGKKAGLIAAVKAFVFPEPKQPMKLPEKSDNIKTLVLAGTNAERKEILDSIRERLKETGRLGESTRMEGLRAKDLTKEAANLVRFYEVGDVLVPEEKLARLGLERGIQYEVVGKGKTEIHLRSPSGEEIKVNPDAIKNKSVFAKEEYEVAVGDKMKWTKNDYSKDRRNGEELIVVGVDGHGITLRNSKGADISVSTRTRQYLDHSLVSTAYGSQGKTAERVLLVGDNTIGKESMYVAISRAKHMIKIFVDSYEKMVQRAERSQAKRTALELFTEKAPKESKKAEKSQDPYLKSISSDLKSGKAHAAFIQLKPFIKEVSDPVERYTALAKQYASLGEDERKKVAILAPSREEAQKLKSYVRKELHAAGHLKNLEKVTLLEPKTRSKDGKIELEVGDVLIPDKGSSLTRTRKAVQYRVSHIDGDDVLVKSPAGKPLLVKRSEFQGEVLVEKKNSLAEGDIVLRTGAGSKVVLGRVSEIGGGKVHVALDDGRSEAFRLDKPIPLDHAVVHQAFKRIGENKDKVLMTCDHTIGTKALGQAVDKANMALEVFTDNSRKMEARFEWYQEQSLKNSMGKMPAAKDISSDLGLSHSNLSSDKKTAKKVDRQQSLEMDI